MIVRNAHLVALAVLGIALLGCDSAAAPTVRPSAAPATTAATQGPSAEPSVTPSASPSSAVVESERHRYRITVPPDWTRVEYDGEWTALEEFGVGVEVPGEDVIDSSTLGAFLVMNSMAIPDGMSGEAWLAALDAIVQRALPADCPATASTAMVAGVEAVVLTQACGGTSIIGRSLVHGGRGYYVTTVAPTDGDAGPILEQMVSSIEFLD